MYTFLLFFFPSSFSFFVTVPFFLVPLALLIGDRAYLPLNISLFLPFRHNFYAFIASSLPVSMFRSRNRFDHPLSFLSFFPPSAPLITPEMIFFCAPLYAPFAARFRTFLLRSFAFVMTGIIYLISFYASTIYIRRLVTRLSLSLSLMTLLFLIMHFLKATRKIIKIIRLLYRIISYSCLISFFKTVYKQFWRFNLYVLHA